MIDDTKVLEILKARLSCIEHISGKYLSFLEAEEYISNKNSEELLYIKYGVDEDQFKKFIHDRYNLSISMSVDGIGINFPINNMKRIISIIERDLKIDNIINR